MICRDVSYPRITSPRISSSTRRAVSSLNPAARLSLSKALDAPRWRGSLAEGAARVRERLNSWEAAAKKMEDVLAGVARDE